MDHNLLILKNFYQSVAQPGRALRLGRRCCWFKSSHFDFFMQGYTVGVAGQTVNLLSLDSGSATLSPCTNSNSWLYRLVQFNMKVHRISIELMFI